MRMRDTTRWGVGKLYPAPNFLTADLVSDGLHTIQLGNQLLDILLRIRQSPATVVSFHHRVSTRSTYPTLVGEGITKKVGANLIAVADPSVAMDSRVRLGWYLGNRPIGKLKPILKPLLDTAIEALDPKRLIFFGSSGGGYAAMSYASEYPGSIALTVNPRLSFKREGNKDWAAYMEGCHGPLGKTPYQRISAQYGVDLKDEIPTHAPFHVAMYHNTGDTDFYEKNHKPFVDARSEDLDLAQRLEFDGAGHVPIPKERLTGILRSLTDTSVPPCEALKQAGFTHPSAEPDITSTRLN